MVQTTLNDIRKNDTANLFRADALHVGLGVNANEIPTNSEYEIDPVTGRIIKKKETENQRALAQRSGQVMSDGTTREGARIEAREAEAVRSVQQAAIGGSTTIFGSLYNSATSTVKSWFNSAKETASGIYDSATEMAYEYLIDPANRAIKSGREMWNEYVYNPVAQKLGEAKEWAGQKIDAAGTAISNKFTAAKDWTMSWFQSDEPAQQQPQAVQQQATATPNAAAQELSGAKNNPDAGISLKSTWDSLSSGVTNALGFGTPAPTNVQKLSR